MSLSRGIVDEDVDWAKLLRHGPDCLLDGDGVREFRPDGETLVIAVANACDYGLGGFTAAAIMRCDRRARLRQTKSDAATDPPDAPVTRATFPFRLRRLSTFGVMLVIVSSPLMNSARSNRLPRPAR